MELLPWLAATSTIRPRGGMPERRTFLPRNGPVWNQQAELIADDGSTNDLFGFSVALDSAGTTALVGSFGHDAAGHWDAGAAYVFTYNGAAWAQQYELIASDAASSDN